MLFKRLPARVQTACLTEFQNRQTTSQTDSSVMSSNRSQSNARARKGECRTAGKILRHIRTQFRENHYRDSEEDLVEKIHITDQKKYRNLVEMHPEIRYASDDLLEILCLWSDMTIFAPFTNHLL